MIKQIIVIVPVIAIILGMMTATLTIPVKAQSGCPDPGQCTCNPKTGVLTDHAMVDPNNPGQLLPGASMNANCDGTGN
jgi:hypothetical protein